MSGLENISWHMFLSPQEEILIGSTPEDKYMGKFYTPKAIQNGYATILVNELRQKAQTYPALTVYFVNAKGENPEPDKRFMSTKVVLAPLTYSGETIHDPKPLDESFHIEEQDKKRLKFRE